MAGERSSGHAGRSLENLEYPERHGVPVALFAPREGARAERVLRALLYLRTRRRATVSEGNPWTYE
jgi:hypothetical protein